MTLSIGHRLRIAREGKGLSLPDVAHQTRIPVSRLRDLEEDTYTTFGSLTYARNFLKDYSKLMGVDASEVMEQLHAPPLGGTQDYRYLLQNYGNWFRGRSSASRGATSSSVMPKGGSMGLVAAICAAVMLVGMGMLLGAAFLGDRKPVTQASLEPPIEIRAAKPAPLPETQVPSFAAPKAVPVEEDRTQPASVSKPKIAPGVIPKALPVDVPKAIKPQR